MALSSENRLKSATLISLVCKKGASWKTPFFRCVFLPSKSREKRFQAVVIPSKKNIDNRATERNKIRRKITGILQQKKSEISQNPDMHFPENIYVIFPYESAIHASTQDLSRAINQMLESTKNWDFSRKPRKFVRQK